MGKKTDRMYLTMKEWTQDFGGKKTVLGEGATEFRPLPFYCCSLSMQPFDVPVCTIDGIIYDLTNILPWLKKHKIDPVTGKSMSADQLIKLHFHKNDDDKFHCPVTFKEFTDFSHIVAIKTTGQVYSWDAVEELNIRAKNWKDLLTDEKFTRADIITLQDPKNLERRNMSTFFYLQQGLKPQDETSQDPLNNIQISESRKQILRAANEKYEQKAKETEEMIREYRETEGDYITGEQWAPVSAEAPGFTSTTVSGKFVGVLARDHIKTVDEKAYVVLHTNFGKLNLELHSDIVPKTVENFLGLAESGYYSQMLFHKLVPGEYIQVGDPTGTGNGGKSFWGKPFKDEFSNKLQHTGRGIVSMANTGPDSNRSQFMITFERMAQFNLKNAVFGKVVRGMEVLDELERQRVDFKGRPVDELRLEHVEIINNPFKLNKEAIQAKKAAKIEKEEQEKEDKKKGQWYSNPGNVNLKPVKQGIGKYMTTPAVPAATSTTPATPAIQADSAVPPPVKESQGTKRNPPEISKLNSVPVPQKKKSYGNFSNW